MLGIIGEMQPDEKGVIFSQWTRHLDIIETAMERAGIPVTRIDGSMSAEERLVAMQDLQSDEKGSPRFMLCSLLAVGIRVSLTRANVAIMMDSWWNFAIESQVRIQQLLHSNE